MDGPHLQVGWRTGKQMSFGSPPPVGLLSLTIQNYADPTHDLRGLTTMQSLTEKNVMQLLKQNETHRQISINSCVTAGLQLLFTSLMNLID